MAEHNFIGVGFLVMLAMIFIYISVGHYLDHKKVIS